MASDARIESAYPVACRYLRAVQGRENPACQKCPELEEEPGYGKVKRMCRAMADELCQFVLAAADRVALAQAGELVRELAEADAFQKSRPLGGSLTARQAQLFGEAAATLTAQAARIAELEAALRPFARIALVHDMTKKGPDMVDGPDLEITAAEVRAARAALGAKP